MKDKKRTLWFCIALVFVGLLSRLGATTVIDIMLVYDSTAKAWVDANGGMALFSTQAVSRMNQAVDNSEIDASFRLVHAAEVPYTHVDLSSDLTAIRQGSGDLAVVHEWRNTYGADLVALLVDTGSAYGTVGMGYVLSNAAGSPNFAYTSNAIRSVEISHTLTHEVGHNMGGGHAKNQASQPGPGPFSSYSAGWYFTGTNGTAYHTIMAYNRDGFGGEYISAPLFSSPLITYEGTVAGHAADGDNSRTIRETKGVVAAYRTAVELAPMNDDFADAIVLNGASGQTTGTNLSATKEAGEPFHWSTTGGQSVWWRWTAVADGEVVIDTFGSDFDTILAVYTGSAVGALNQVASNDDDSGFLQSRVSFTASAGTTYHIAVDGWGSLAGQIVLNWAQAVREIRLEGSLAFGEVEVGSSATRTLIVESPGNSPLTLTALEFPHAAFSSAWTGPQTLDPGDSLALEVVFAPTATHLYEGNIRVLSDANAGEDLRFASGLGIPDLAPANDDFADAIVISGASGQTTGSNVDATMEAGEPFHWSTTGGRSVWWRWTAVADGEAVIDTFGSDFDTILAVYTGSSVDALNLVGANDDFGSLQSQVSFDAMAGMTYHIAVDGWGSLAGQIVLNWSSMEDDPGEPDRPDFFIAMIHLDDRSPHVGQTVNARVTVRNRGNSAGDAGWLDIWANLPEAPSVEDVLAGLLGDFAFEVGDLEPGERATFDFSFVAETEGPQVFRAFIDSENLTIEQIESNNQFTLDYAIQPPWARSLVAWARQNGLPQGKRGLQDVAGRLPLTNAQAYAMGVNPMAATAANLPRLVESPESAEIRLRYDQSIISVGHTTFFEVSEDLEEWSTRPPIAEAVVGLLPGAQAWEARFERNPAAPTFVRMGVDLPGWVLRRSFPDFGDSAKAAAGAEDRMHVYAGVDGTFTPFGNTPVRILEMNGADEVLREFFVSLGLRNILSLAVSDDGEELIFAVGDLNDIVGFISLADGSQSSFSLLQVARDLAVSPTSDRVYVTGIRLNGEPRTRAFTRNGSVAFIWPYGTAHAGQLVNPKGIATDESGDVFIFDDGLLKRYSAAGAFLDAHPVDLPDVRFYGMHVFGNGFLIRTALDRAALVSRTGEVLERGVPWGRYRSGLLYTTSGVYERNPFAPPLDID